MRFSLSASLVGVVIAVTLTSVVHSEGGKTDPDAVRPGSCPMMIQGCPDNQPRDKTECTSDSQCPSPLKCCSTPCGGAGCMQPDNLPEPQPTYCPDYRAMRIACDGTRVIERCIDNKNCTGGKICCRSPCGGTECFVGGTQKPETKPGECEPVNWASIQCLTMSDEDRQVECTRDTDCEGEKKCCDNPCTNQRCRDPQEVYKGDDQGDDNDDQSDDDDVKPTKPGHCYMHTMGCPAGAPADPIECDNDYNCTENLKCCSTSCFGMTCQKPQPGYCPDYRLMLVQSCNGTRETCIDDDSCAAGKLCCRSPCGGFECMEQVDYPPATKPGTCAYVPWELIDCAPMDEESRQTECTQDYDCDGELKCCENACSNKRCKPKSEKPGMCEDFSNIRPLCVQGAWENSTADCVDDQGCEGNKKCCQQLCVKPQCKAPLRAGRCPFTIQGCPSNATTAKPACVEDFDCPEDHKCCQDGCGNAVCSRADHEVRYGVCPAQTEMACAPDTPKKDECQYDDECLYGMKCCERNCQGKLCVYPDNEKEEETPYPSFVCPYWDASRNCLLPNDQECTVENKCADGSQCCQYECSGTRCESVLCPAPNPGVRCVMMNPLACNASDDCGDDSICCTYECGGRKCIKKDSVQTILPKVKPGECMVTTQGCVDIANRPNDTCKTDDDCKGSDKCCAQSCGNLQCVPAVIVDPGPVVHPGQCPANPLPPGMGSGSAGTSPGGPGSPGSSPGAQGIPGIECQVRCTNRTDCAAGQLCCNTGFFATRCMTNDQCPQIAAPAPGTKIPCSILCTDDVNCGVGNMCCRTGDGGTACREIQYDASGSPYCPHVMPPAPPTCRHTCDSDASCASNEKCCKNDCGGMQCVPVKDEVVVHPGQCPAGPVPSGSAGSGSGHCGSPGGDAALCTFRCTNDSQCNAGQKCCKSGFTGTTCWESGIDQCPVFSPPAPGTIINCTIHCSNDGDCGADSICCQTSPNTTQCIKKGQSGQSSCPQIMPPPPSTCPHTCDSDAPCAPNEKCCKNDCGGTQCYPVQEVVHPGQCPAGPVPSGSAGSGSGSVSSPGSDAALCTFRCTNDSQCKAGHKCCQYGFSGTVCWDFTGIVTGQCPQIGPPGPGTIINCAIHCTNDGDCGTDSICCQTSSNTTQCIKKGQSGQSSCPQIMPPPPSTCPHTCDSDAPCAPNEKCCKNDCGGTQCYPVQDTPVPYPSFVCPYWDPNRACLVPNPQECKIGSLCDDGSQCCQYECSGTRCQRAMCPAPNPAIRCALPNPKTCNASDHCGTDGICCGYECSGRKCIKKEHPGTCPNTTGTIGTCAFSCQGDHNCADSEKCCTNGCGGTNCMPTVESGNNGGSGVVVPNPPERQTPAPPVCPVFDPKATCGSSGDKRKPHTCDPAQKCSDGGKCCQYECEGTRCETDLCPAPNTSINCFAQESRDCNKSADCGEDKKCCEIHCGGTRCFPREAKRDDGKGGEGNTQPPKQIDQAAPGTLVCPNNPSIRCTPALQKRSCTGDSQCGNKKCCDTGCDALKICQTPVRQGSCPVINVRCAQATSSDAENQCGTDMGCQGNQKCCNHPCPGFGTRCYEPVA